MVNDWVENKLEKVLFMEDEDDRLAKLLNKVFADYLVTVHVIECEYIDITTIACEFDSNKKRCEQTINCKISKEG